MSPKVLFVILILSISAIFIAAESNRNTLRKEGYMEISVPVGEYTNTYWTKEYREDNGCIIFTDYEGKERKICGSYSIIKH